MWIIVTENVSRKTKMFEKVFEGFVFEMFEEEFFYNVSRLKECYLLKKI